MMKCVFRVAQRTSCEFTSMAFTAFPLFGKIPCSTLRACVRIFSPDAVTISDNPDYKGLPDDFKDTWGKGETIEFSGKAIVHLAQDPDVMKKTGRVLYTVDLAREYKFTEDDGTLPVDLYSIRSLLMMAKRTWMAKLVPDWVAVPKTLVYLSSFKL